MRAAPSLLQLIPDLFFDVLAYILPASLLAVGVMAIPVPSSVASPLLEAYMNVGVWFDRFIIILFGIGVLYIIGQLLTHISEQLIMLPLRQLASLRHVGDFTKSDIEWMPEYTFIRHTDATLGMEISKRYARTIMSRNNALVALILMILSTFSYQWPELIISGFLFSLFLHEAYSAQIFFARYLREMTKELKKMKLPAQEEDST